MASDNVDGSQKDFYDDVNKRTSESDQKLDEMLNGLQKYREKCGLLKLALSLTYDPKHLQFAMVEQERQNMDVIKTFHDQLDRICNIPPAEIADLIPPQSIQAEQEAGENPTAS